MYYYGCTLIQDFDPAVDLSVIPWRTDLLLPQPKLLYPRADAVICLDTQPGAGSNIFLEWDTVGGADTYIVQWAGNSEFTGPSVREEKVSAPTTQYELITDDDIRIGETIYWRVLAVNEATGGASVKSEQRQITFNCNTNQSGYGLDRCTDYDVQMKVNGVEYLSSCDEGTYWLELNYDCKDQFDRTLIEIDKIEWSVQNSPNHGTAAFINKKSHNDLRAIVLTSAEETQVVRICCTVTFNDLVIGDTFECSACKKVLIDATTPYHTRPWMPGGKDPYFKPISIYEYYCSPEPLGLLSNPPCDCDTECLRFIQIGIPNETSFNLDGHTGFMAFYDEDDFAASEATFCGTDAMVAYIEFFSVSGGATFEIEVISCGEVVHTQTKFVPDMTSDVFELVFQPEQFRPFTECDCTVTINLTHVESGQKTFFSASGLGGLKENCLISDYNVAIATGPVYCIPITSCDGIRTECCKCTPERVGATFTAGEDVFEDVLVFSELTNQWESQGPLFNAFGCEGSLGPSWMYCQDPYWVFEAFVACEDCIFVDGGSCDDCVPDKVSGTMEISFDETACTEPLILQGTESITLNHKIGQKWIVNDGTIEVHPPCITNTNPIILENVTVEFDGTTTPIVFLDDSKSIDWHFVPSAFFSSLLGCDPLDLLITTRYESTDGLCCVEIELVFDGQTASCDTCFENITLTYPFYACNPFQASFELYDESLPSSIYVDLYEDTTYGYCAGQGAGGETVALEARVNIPLGCHFKVEGGVLQLDLEALLGPGIGLGISNINSPCPYIIGYGTGGDCYQHTYIYCCYTVYEVPTYGLASGYTGAYSGPVDSFNYEFNYEFN